MDQIKWCLQTKNGIELVEPNQNLAQGYIKKAEESLQTSMLAKSKDWKIAASYYTIYFSVYSLMMQLGIKCEIHTCTIAFAKIYLQEKFSKEELKLFETAFTARNDTQYYTNREVTQENYEKIIRQAPVFLVKCKNIHFTEDKIKEVREKIKNHK